jgi:nicotinamidase-related amidase
MTVIIAMGLQNSYFNKNGSLYLGDVGEVLKKNLKNFFNTIDKKDIIFFTREIHTKEDSFYRSVISHSLVGSDDINILEDFKSYPKFIVNTCRYNAFYITPLESELKKINSKRVILVGVETHTNILFTAEELRNRDYDVIIYKDLINSRDDFMNSLGINILTNVLSVELL